MFLRVEFQMELKLSLDNKLRVVYSKTPVDGALCIFDSGFLWQDDLLLFEPETGTWNNITTLFPAPEGFSLPFDVFAATFYMLSRYEEYLPFEADAHGRFPAKQSLAYRKSFLEVPVVDYWIKWLADELLENGAPSSGLISPSQPIVTMDIDTVYTIRGKGLLRQCSAVIKPMFRGEWPVAIKAFLVILGRQRDPFDRYDYLFRRFEGKEKWLQLFVLCAPVGKYDRAVSPRKKAFRDVVRQLAERFDVGLHPSYASFGKPAMVAKQKLILEKITEKPVTKVRQHFLLYRFPETANIFIDEGLTHDYTLGFADHPGYRAGTCRSFPFFDLKKKSMRPLTLIPFAFMDRTLKDRIGLTPEGAIVKIRQLISACSGAGVLPMGLWHNDTLSDYGEWAGWKAVFEACINELEEAHGRLN